MPINLSNVNISLQQFQDISSGKYNAGEVALASETTLAKVNNHVRQKRSTRTTPCAPPSPPRSSSASARRGV